MGFDKTLKALRKAAGWSQVELATRSGTPLDNLRNWEQGRALPRIDALKRLATALGVSADRLIEEVELDPPAPEPKPPATRSKKRGTRRPGPGNL